jgi:glycosyltransferase involved in cell wall biosynthesis
VKIVAIITVYQSDDVILRCLESVVDCVDEVLCFDGRWEFYKGPDHSTDKTKEIITEFAKIHSKVKYIELPVMHQWQARTEMFKYLELGDWGFVLDSDEEVKYWSEDIRQTLEATKEQVFRIHYGPTLKYPPIYTPNLMKKTENFRYSTDHRRVFDKDGEIDLVHPPPIDIVKDHQSNSEKKKMRSQSDEYKVSLFAYESSHWNPEDIPTCLDKEIQNRKV